MSFFVFPEHLSIKFAQLCFFFFFQAEDGIRDADVTGVQTCALPICPPPRPPPSAPESPRRSAPCRARDRARRGDGVAQSRRGLSGALGGGLGGGRGIPRPGEKEPRALLPDALRHAGRPIRPVEYLAADRSGAAPGGSADPR